MNGFICYFDLASDARSKATKERSADGKPLHWFWQYLALVAGILVQPFFATYQQTGIWSFEGFAGRIWFALIAGIVVFPGVYRNSFDPEKPIFVQCCGMAGQGQKARIAAVARRASPRGSPPLRLARLPNAGGDLHHYRARHARARRDDRRGVGRGRARPPSADAAGGRR